jgi:hypothetical protein
MDKIDEEFSRLLSVVKGVSIAIVRPMALAIAALMASATQVHFSYPSFTLAIIVFILSASGYAARFAYGIVFYLCILVLVTPEVVVFLKLIWRATWKASSGLIL